MLSLKTLQGDLSKARGELTSCLHDIAKIADEQVTHLGIIAGIRENLNYMHDEAKVVLMGDYLGKKETLEIHEEYLVNLAVKLKTMEDTRKKISASVQALEDQVEKLKKDLQAEGKVLEFTRSAGE